MKARSVAIALTALLLSLEARAQDEDWDARVAELRKTCGLASRHMTCETAPNLVRVTNLLLQAPAPSGSSPGGQRWDRKSRPQYFDSVNGRFGLTPTEERMLFAQGFVVPARLEYTDFANAFHEVHQSQLPLYVSVDAVLHAIFKGNDVMTVDLEAAFRNSLGYALERMHQALPSARAAYTAETFSDLDLYLAIARSLLADEPVAPVSTDLIPRRDDLLTAVANGGKVRAVNLFGRERAIDFAAFTPRGHYAGALAPYFRAVTWLSRLELNLASRSCRAAEPGATPNPEETPREAVGALALADLAKRAKVLKDLDAVEHAWTVLAGAREDVSLGQLDQLRRRAKIASLKAPDVAERLRAAIGDRYRRTFASVPMPQGVEDLPVVATILGARVAAGVGLMSLLVHDQVADRFEVGVADVAYTLGHERAREYLSSELARFPQLAGQLARARALATPAPRGADLASAWFGAIRGLGEKPRGIVPSFMETPAWADLRLNSTVAAWGQLKHAYVLMQLNEYDGAGCEIPDGYVEPAPAVYDALIAYADRGDEALKRLGNLADHIVWDREYFARLGKHLRVLRAIGAEELANHSLSDAAKEYLAMTVEVTAEIEDSGYQPSCAATYRGWYFELFPKRWLDAEEPYAFAPAEFVIDFFTSTNTGQSVYAGARRPRLGVFVIDTGGAPRLAVEPVAHAFEYRSVGPKLTDADVGSLEEKALGEPWSKSYTVPRAAEPAATIRCKPEKGIELACVVEAGAAAPSKIIVSRLDYHGVVAESVSLPLGPTPARHVFRKKVPFERMLRVEWGEFRGEYAAGTEEIRLGVRE